MIINESNDYGVRYVVVNKQDRLITKQKFFSTEKARDKFIDKLEKQDDFVRIDSYSDPKNESINESFKSGDMVCLISANNNKPWYEIIREATPDDFKKYGGKVLNKYSGKKYVVRSHAPSGPDTGDTFIVLETNLKKG